MPQIDPDLLKAATTGDVHFLRTALSSNNDAYFLGVSVYGSNILNTSIYNRREAFVREAIQTLPTHILQKLLSNQQHDRLFNPFHEVALIDHLQLLRLMLGFYKNNGLPLLVPEDVNHPLNKPWLAPNNAKHTPLHFAIMYGRSEECAMEILSMDMELQCRMVDKDGNSPLFLALQKGFNQVSQKILSSQCSYSLSGKNGSTALHVATKSSGNVIKLLLKKHLDLLDKVDSEGLNVVSRWAKEGSIKHLLQLLILDEEDFLANARSKIFGDLICIDVEVENINEGPLLLLHLAIMDPDIEFVKAFIHFYQKTNSSQLDGYTPPWKIQSNNGDTALHMVLNSSKLEEHGLYLLELDSTLSEIRNNKGESPLLAAVRGGCDRVVEKIINLYPNPDYNMLRRNDGLTLLHLLKFCSEITAKRLLGKFWWMIHLRDDKGRSAFDEVKEDTPWLANLLMNPSSIQREPFDWDTACRRNESRALMDFIHASNDLEEICRKENDTPLHHIQFESYRDYMNFLKLPSIKELKNATDREGATPLHRALQRKDINLAKALLVDNDVERNIADYNGNTALGLLAQLWNEDDDWVKMCKEIKVNPYLKTTYIQSRTNLGEMRNTLSVVAALLATITFAAGFTLPGGLNSSTGYGMLATKVPFLVFLLADAYAMCASMLVLFCLIWSMISDRDMSYFLVDRSVLILMQSLYGTLLAFMTGIYAVIAHDSLWAAIIVVVLCSLICISVNRTVLREIITKLIPALIAKLCPTSKKDDHCVELLEEGNNR